MRRHARLVPTLVCLAALAGHADAADPELRNWGLGALRSLDVAVTSAALHAADADTAAAQLVYTITAKPTRGTLRLDGVPLDDGSTFTQADIDAGRLLYRHQAGGDDAMDVVAFTLSDGGASQAHTLRIMIGPGLGTTRPFRMQKVGEYRVPSGFSSAGGVAEIVVHDHGSQRLFLVNGVTATVDVLGFGPGQVTAPPLIATLDPKTVVAEAADVTSVAVHDGLVAVAVAHSTRTSPGFVFFYTAATGAYVSHIAFVDAIDQVGGVRGALPDMVTFTPDGSKVLLAIEGEPASDYSIDPDGGIVVVDVVAGVPAATATWIGFDDGQTAAYQAAGVRIYNAAATTAPAASAAQDLEPEYIVISADSATAYVSLQENNAIAVIDLASATVTAVRPLGFKDHQAAGMGLDASDRDGPANSAAINIDPRPFRGMYQPDGMAILASGHLLTANEGDTREYAALVEESRMSAMPNGSLDAQWLAAWSKSDSRWSRLTVARYGLSHDSGNETIEAPQVFGARSFSIWNPDGSLLWDSGDHMERFFAAYAGVGAVGDGAMKFNATHADNAPDTRSDNKGPEPESVVSGTVHGRTYAFVGLERMSGVMVYDVTDPTDPDFSTYYSGRLWHGEGVSGGDLGPEGLLFIDAARSPSDRPLLIVGNEVSGTVAIHALDHAPTLSPQSFTLNANGAGSGTIVANDLDGDASPSP